MLCSECVSCQHGSVRFCQIAGGTYRGETQAVVFARNVFYCLSGLKMLCPMQSQNNRRIKSFLCPGVGIIMFYCSYNYHCQAYFGQENVLKPTMLLLLWSWREWGVWMKKEWMSVVVEYKCLIELPLLFYLCCSWPTHPGIMWALYPYSTALVTGGGSELKEDAHTLRSQAKTVRTKTDDSRKKKSLVLLWIACCVVSCDSCVQRSR